MIASNHHLFPDFIKRHPSPALVPTTPIQSLSMVIGVPLTAVAILEDVKPLHLLGERGKSCPSSG